MSLTCCHEYIHLMFVLRVVIFIFQTLIYNLFSVYYCAKNEEGINIFFPTQKRLGLFNSYTWVCLLQVRHTALKKRSGLHWWSRDWESALPVQGTQVQSVPGLGRSHMREATTEPALHNC